MKCQGISVFSFLLFITSAEGFLLHTFCVCCVTIPSFISGQILSNLDCLWLDLLSLHGFLLQLLGGGSPSGSSSPLHWLLSQGAQASITGTTDWVAQTTDIYFLTVLEVEVQDQVASTVKFW